MQKRVTAALVIIGDEILSAQIAEKNAIHALPKFREWGVDLRAIHFIPDDIDDIAERVSSCSKRFDWVVTSGGIGPTHDDVTMESVAKAFGVKVARDAGLVQRLESLLGPAASEGHLRLADIPVGAEVISEESKGLPLIRFENVFILPGIPEYFERKFGRLASFLKAEPFVEAALYLSLDEANLAEVLDAVAARHASVQIGSYPKTDEDHRTMLTVKGKDLALVRQAFAELAGKFDAHVLRVRQPD